MPIPMKKLLAACLMFFAVAISAFTLAAEADAGRADDLVVFGETRRVTIGMNRDQVAVCMQGQPDEKFTQDVWIYWDFHPKGLLPRYESYTALVIVFVADRVKLIRLADAEATKALLTRYRDVPVKKIAAR